MKTVYDLIGFDENVVKELNKLMNRPIEGSLLWKYWDDREKRTRRDKEIRYQTAFLIEKFDEINPKKILEVGTYKAFFPYFCKCYDPEITIDTFGNDNDSQACVDYLNSICVRPTTTFHLGDSKETLSTFAPDYNIDFAWVDGGHTEDIAFSDLVNCARLGIRNVSIDDVDMYPVRKAVDKFLAEFSYQKSDESMSVRKIFFLKSS